MIGRIFTQTDMSTDVSDSKDAAATITGKYKPGYGQIPELKTAPGVVRRVSLRTL
jgi:hypothetical protein